MLEYIDKCGINQGFLLVLDYRKNISWKEKAFKKIRTINGVKIDVYGIWNGKRCQAKKVLLFL
jgi:hypothetical protein